jgi:hypothetical protein
VVAVIDGGIDVDHLDLKNNIWVNADEVPDNGVDDDRNGYVDDRNGYASLAQTAPPENTKPAVSLVKPSPRTRDRTPAVTVRDDTELSEGNIRLSLDGRERAGFSYDAGTDRLT